MSFASFGPLPRPQPNPIPGLPALEAAIQRLEATSPTLASRDAGATPPIPASREAGAPRGFAGSAAVPGSASPGGRGSGETGGSALWRAIALLLAEIDPDVRGYVQQVFATTLEAAEADLALPPEGRRLAPIDFWVQHLGRPRFHEVHLWEQDQGEIDSLLRCAIWRAVDALEAAALLPARAEVYLSILAEQCAQFERVYQHLKKRAGGGLAALWIAQGELKLLRHRGSRVIEQMLFS